MWAKFDPDMLRRIEQELRQLVEKAMFKPDLDEDWDDAAPRPAPMPFRYDAEIDGDE